jgi:hypothetical protein
MESSKVILLRKKMTNPVVAHDLRVFRVGVSAAGEVDCMGS